MAKQQRVCIIGAGAAGIGAAYSLAQKGNFSVTVYDKNSQAGGVATSVDVDYVDSYINDGVQGGSGSYRNTLNFHGSLGFNPTPVAMKVSFGKGPTHWNNQGPAHETDLVRALRPEIKRFGDVLWWINKFEPLFLFLSINFVLRIFRFSDRFRNLMVFPLTALFFGTGNQTPNVSAAIIARVFLDADLRLFDYDPSLLLSQSPDMFAFPSLDKIYRAAVEKIKATFHFNRGVASVRRFADRVDIVDESGAKDSFDFVIFACDAETALRLLGPDADLRERLVLGNVCYFNDVTVTHTDEDYMRRHYELDARGGAQYFIRVDEADATRLDMSFNLSNYQPQLAGRPPLYQTIFLDDAHRAEWTMGEIDEKKVVLVKWWRQFAHTWRHFAFTVPFVRLLQNRRRTLFCGAYTLVNTHEAALISGLAAAFRLNKWYPFSADKLAAQQFDTYLRFIHGVRR